MRRRGRVWMVMLVGVAILLPACASGGRVTEPGCAAWRPVFISRADVLTPETAHQILAHNETGASVCGWGR